MFSKRILILTPLDKSFAESGKELCGMVKLVSYGNKTDVKVFVTNARHLDGDWFFAVAFDDRVFVNKLTSMNAGFSLSEQNLSNVSCLVTYRDKKCYSVMSASCGVSSVTRLVASADELTRESAATVYERYLDGVTDFYPKLDVETIKNNSNKRYKSVEDYSDAFERFYASGGVENYYQSVKNEIFKVFVSFPPYFPLTRRYKDSFFVRIDFPSSNKYFVLGVLQQNGAVKYICYGLPAGDKQIDDKDFVLVKDETQCFWMLFQDAVTGQITTLSEAV